MMNDGTEARLAALVVEDWRRRQADAEALIGAASVRLLASLAAAGAATERAQALTHGAPEPRDAAWYAVRCALDHVATSLSAALRAHDSATDALRRLELYIAAPHVAARDASDAMRRADHMRTLSEDRR